MKNFTIIFLKLAKDIPNIVRQLNVYVDQQGLLRVKCKLDRFKSASKNNFPILLSKDSYLTKLIIHDTYLKLKYSGIYSILVDMRKHFWIPRCFVTVKKVLKTCKICKRFHGRTFKINQSPYKEFRLDPQNIPYRYIILDHIRPFEVKQNNERTKV